VGRHLEAARFEDAADREAQAFFAALFAAFFAASTARRVSSKYSARRSLASSSGPTMWAPNVLGADARLAWPAVGWRETATHRRHGARRGPLMHRPRSQIGAHIQAAQSMPSVGPCFFAMASSSAALFASVTPPHPCFGEMPPG
jgi:hypothetical protein